jgi:hypothetical protein
MTEDYITYQSLSFAATGAEQCTRAVARRLAMAGTVASSAAYVTGKLAALVGQASYATALAIAKTLPGHKKRSSGSSTSEIVTPEERSALHTVGAAGLVAFVDVYDSLEQAAKVVLAQSGEATTQYITYK